MKTKYFISFVGLLFGLQLSGQQAASQLQNFANPALFNLNDNSCLNISGEWLGEETEYVDQYPNIKGKYSCKFILSQQGNKVEGLTLISFDNGQSFGKMKIRGMVLGNKFHFEEYEIAEQQMAKTGVLWCLRSGELDIRSLGNKVLLEGANYKGYADYYYFDCPGRVRMDLSKNAPPSDATNTIEKAEGTSDLQLRPNPAGHEVTVLFKLQEDQQVQIDMFTLSGNFIANVTKGFCKAGTHERLFDLSPYPAGVYLVRMSAGKESAASLLVIAR